VRKMPQIPRDVFFGPAAAPEPEAEPAEAVVAPPPVLRAVPVDEDKVQVTVYLSPQTAKRLEALRFHLLNEHNVKVSKSAIAEYAITHIDDDLVPLAQFFAMGER
jgi:hypothetical protein